MVQLSESQIGKIGFFGGTFDPPHNGHLSLLQFALDEFALDRVLLSPSFSTPLRKNAPLYTPQQRLHMVEKLAKLHPRAMVFDYEISQTKLSYTYDSILIRNFSSVKNSPSDRLRPIQAAYEMEILEGT